MAVELWTPTAPQRSINASIHLARMLDLSLRILFLLFRDFVILLLLGQAIPPFRLRGLIGAILKMAFFRLGYFFLQPPHLHLIELRCCWHGTFNIAVFADYPNIHNYRIMPWGVRHVVQIIPVLLVSVNFGIIWNAIRE